MADEFLSALLARSMAPVDPDVAAAVDAGPMDPAGALALSEVARLLDRGDPTVETGWCRLPDGTGYTAVGTPMPEVTGEMLDWWFDWHPYDPLRYRVWFPGAHADTSFEPAPSPKAKPYWDTIHHPVEDVGLGMQHLRIRFMDPIQFGFPPGALEDPSVATIVCAVVGDDRRRVWHTRMCHVALPADGGIGLRSRFWLGAALKPFIRPPIAKPLATLMNTSAVRRRLIPDRAPRAMAQHCAAEYANLASLLPELYQRYS